MSLIVEVRITQVDTKPYKKITGLDEPVIRFLEDDGEILEFLKPVYKLADHHVERYNATWLY